MTAREAGAVVNLTERDHSIPQLYLKHFAREGYIVCKSPAVLDWRELQALS